MSKTTKGEPGMLLATIAVVVGVVAMCSGGGNSKPTPPVSADASARAICKEFATRALHDPASVDWGESWNWTTVKNADGSYSVGMKFRAKNGFGALRATEYTCVTRNTSGDSWNLESLTKIK